MQNLKSTEQILYRGVDWLRIGYYLVRMNSSFFTEKRKIYHLNDIEEATNLHNIVKLATKNS